MLGAGHWAPGSTGPRLLDCLTDALASATTYGLIYFYSELSAFDETGPSRRHAVASRLAAWTFLGAALLVYQCLWTFTAQTPPTDPLLQPVPFRVIYGLGQGTALFLVVGRLESSAIIEHITALGTDASKGLANWHRWGVPVGYLYASIQPLYALFGPTPTLQLAGLVLVASVLKLVLLIWLLKLFRRPPEGDKPSPMEFHVYEALRFRTEEGTSFERSFLRRHFNPVFRKRFHEREIGYLGVEYAYLNEFKLGALELGDAVGAILVREVYAGSDAMRQGIRVGDLITTIDGMPVSTGNRIGRLLVGTKPGSHVDVGVKRRRAANAGLPDSPTYEALRFRVRLHHYERLIKNRVPYDAKVQLGYDFLYNSSNLGVVCRAGAGMNHVTILGLRTGLSDRYRDTPDLRMLRIAIEDLVPGETALLMVAGGNGHPSTSPVPQPAGLACDSHLVLPVALPEFKDMSPVDRARLVCAYPDLFVPADADTNGTTVHALMASGEHYWITCFDRELGKLFEYCVHGDGRRFLGSRVWERIESQDVLAHVRAVTRAPDGRFLRGRDGGFFTFRHERQQPAVTQPGTAATA
jgi:hypothetical protein